MLHCTCGINRKLHFNITRFSKLEFYWNRFTSYKWTFQVQKHQMVATGLKFNASASRNSDIFDLAHFHDIAIHRHFMKLHFTSSWRASREQLIAIVTLVFYLHKSAGNLLAWAAGKPVLTPVPSPVLTPPIRPARIGRVPKPKRKETR